MPEDHGVSSNKGSVGIREGPDGADMFQPWMLSPKD